MLLGKQQRTTIEQLETIPTPEPTATWTPVPHYDVTVTLLDALASNYILGPVELGLNPSATQLFGVAALSTVDHDDLLVGWRNAHDKVFALGITGGKQVMVCSNLCFGGEITINRRHTANLSLERVISDALTLLPTTFNQLDLRITQLQQTPCTKRRAVHLAYLAAEQGWLRPCDILNVVREFEQPQHAEHARVGHTLWTAHNAVTQVVKKYSHARFDKAHKGITKLFDMGSAQ